MKESPRSRSLRLAAEFRAAAVAYVNSLTEFTKASEIIDSMQAKIGELGISEKQALKQLHDLAGVNLFKHKKDEHGHNHYAGKGIILKQELQAGTHWKRAAGKAVEKISGEAPAGKNLPAVASKSKALRKTEEMPDPSDMPDPEQVSRVTIDTPDLKGVLYVGSGLDISIRKVKR